MAAARLIAGGSPSPPKKSPPTNTSKDDGGKEGDGGNEGDGETSGETKKGPTPLDTTISLLEAAKSMMVPVSSDSRGMTPTQKLAALDPDSMNGKLESQLYVD
jgi:hypothetical protein